MLISLFFERDKDFTLHYATEEQRFCKYAGNGVVASPRTFLSKFNVIITNLTDAGGTADEHIFLLRQTFANEFRKVPEFKDSVHKMERSALSSKYLSFAWQWRTANHVLENMLENQKHKQLLANCNYSNANVGAAAAETGGPVPEDEAEPGAVANAGKDLRQIPGGEWAKQKQNTRARLAQGHSRATLALTTTRETHASTTTRRA